MHALNIFGFIVIISLCNACSSIYSQLEALPDLPVSALDSLALVSERFTGLIQTRGAYVDKRYNDIANAITMGQNCTQVSLKRNNEPLNHHGTVNAHKSDHFKIKATRKYDSECNDYGIEHYLLIISSKPHIKNAIFINRIDRGRVNLTFDEDEDYLITPLSAPSRASFIQSFSSDDTRYPEYIDPNLNAKHKILLNHLKAISISNNGNTESQVTWIRQVGKGHIPKLESNSLGLIQANLQSHSGVLVLTWVDDKLAVTLITKKNSQHRLTKYSREHILLKAQNITPYLKIQDLIASRAPNPKRGISVSPDDDQSKDTQKSVKGDIWKELGDAFLPEHFKSSLSGITELQIIPAGELASLPYSALINPNTNRHWIDGFSISIVPDLVGIIDKHPRWSTVPNRKALVIGNPTREQSNDNFTFPDLPGAENEAKKVSEIWPSLIFTNKKATVQSVENNLDNISLLHIAAHGISDTKKPLRNSFLALTPDGELDGNLSGLRVLNKNYSDIDLVVMSACQSGLGYQHQQGTIGLARAFYVSGVPRVVMSLWNVDDDATNYLMEHFHKALKNMPPAKALQYATIKARDRYKSPAKWAPFLLFGTPD